MHVATRSRLELAAASFKRCPEMTTEPFVLHDAATVPRSVVDRLVAEALDNSSSFRGADRLRAAVPDAVHHAPNGVIGSVGDDYVGVVLWTIDHEELMIEVLYVAPTVRGLGLGETLVQRAVDAARASGCRSVAGRALPGDRETKNIYERTGLVSQVITVGKALD